MSDETEYEIVRVNTAECLFARLLAAGMDSDSEESSNLQFLQLKFFHIGLRPAEEEIKEILGNTLKGKKAKIYLMEDGDVVLEWSGQSDFIVERIIAAFMDEYGQYVEEYMKASDFTCYYDFLYNGEDLKLECYRKQGKKTKSAQKLLEYFMNDQLIETFSRTIQLIQMQRSFRTAPHFLVVEDQAFSQTIITSILKDYTVHVVESVAEAVLTYMEKCPDIVLLDINLPDLSGHDFANLINKIDEDSYVVMVSGNKYHKDIKISKANNVKGFLSKPFKKEQLLDHVDRYYMKCKKKSPWG